MAPLNYSPARRFVRLSLILVVLVGVVLTGLFVWQSKAKAKRIARINASWRAVCDDADSQLRDIRTSAVGPVDEYFNVVAIPHIGNFLSDFTGPIDTPTFAWKWVTDKIALRGRSDRVTAMVKGSLDKQLGFPSQFSEAVSGSMIRYQQLLQQRDAGLRDKAYEILHGEGIAIEKAELDRMLADARQIAEDTTFEQVARDSTVNFAGAVVGKEAGILALQSLIIERVMVAVGTRMGIITVGSGVAAATGGAGTVTGVGALPGWALAAGEIAITVVVDLAAGWWLESRAEATMTDQLNDVRRETGSQLGQYMVRYESQLRVKQHSLIDGFAR